MKALVVGAAPRPGAESFYAELAGGHDLVVAADAAGEWLLALGVRPGLVVGDFDSAATGAVERLRDAGVRTAVFPAAKDRTDLEIAVAEARAAGATAVTITAAFADRLDHTLAAFGVLARAADLEGEAREPDFTAWALEAGARPRIDLPLAAGDLVSVLAPLGPATVTLDGMRFPLSGADMPALSSLGVSNVVTDPPARVTVAAGSLVVLAPKHTGA